MSEETVGQDAAETTADRSPEGRFRQLARPHAMRICRAIEAGSRTVESLMATTGLSEATLSNSLRGLAAAGFVVKDRPPDSWCYRYTIDGPGFAELIHSLLSMSGDRSGEPLDSATVIPDEGRGVTS